MNQVEQITSDIINKAIQNKDFVDWESIFDLHDTHGVKCIIIISTKGKTGKSTKCAKYMVKHIIKQGKNGCWIRNTDEEKKKSTLVDTFTSLMYNEGFDLDEWTINTTGIYQNLETHNIRNKGLLKVSFPTINKAMNSSSQNALKCDLIVYDEFINPEFNKINICLAFYNLIKTEQRLANALVILCGNAHESDNDILNGLGISFDWESGKTQVNYYENKKTLAIYVEEYENKYLVEADTDTDAMFSDCEEVQNFRAGKVANNNSFGIKNWMTNKIAQDFTPLFRYTIDDTVYCVGQWQDKIYIKQLVFDEFSEVPTFCYRAKDKRSTNRYVCDIENYQTVRILINAYNEGIMYFSTVWGRDEFRNFILPMLKILLDEQKRKVLQK